jgi:hypothetical protein
MTKRFSLLALLASLGSALPAAAALPFEIQLSDLNSDTVIDGADIALAMSSCGTSYAPGHGGCTIVLPRQTIALTQTLVIGGGATENPVGFIFRGQGACGRATNPPGVTDGTVLSWVGANSGTMIELQRAVRIVFRDLCLVMDPDLVAGGSAARYGVHFDGDPGASDFTQGVTFENVAIWGPASGTPPVGMTAVYVTGTGTPKTAQNDKITFRNSYIRGADVGIHQDALQAAMNRYEGGELFGYTNALKVSGGNFDLRDTIVRCESPSCVTLYLERQVNAGHQETLFSNVYWEETNAATFLKVGEGWSASNTTLGNNAPVIVENSYMTNLRSGASPLCQQTLLDAATQTAVVFRGNHLYTGDLDCGFDVKASNQNTNPYATIYWSENQVRSQAPPAFMSVTLTGTRIGILAPSIDPATGSAYDDKNLNRIKDAGEPLF